MSNAQPAHGSSDDDESEGEPPVETSIVAVHVVVHAACVTLHKVGLQ